MPARAGLLGRFDDEVRETRVRNADSRASESLRRMLMALRSAGRATTPTF
jgi:hypothetical protein